MARETLEELLELAPWGPEHIERCTRCRAMVMQAWGNYGTMWPVVHQQLGVRPDIGRGRLEVIPQLPPNGRPIAGENIRLGSGALALVTASREAGRFRTVVDTGSAPVSVLRIGYTLPRHTGKVTARLDGARCERSGESPTAASRCRSRPDPGATRWRWRARCPGSHDSGA